MVLIAATAAMALGSAPPRAAAEELVIVDVAPVSRQLASHLQVGLDKVPPSVGLPSKLAAVVCKISLKQLRDRPSCVAVGMSQGLIEAVRIDMRNR